MADTIDFKLGIETFKTEHHNKDVKLNGIIRSAEPIKPELLEAAFKCAYCGEVVTLAQGGGKCKLLRPEVCSNSKCISNKPKFILLQDKSEFRDYQEIWLKPDVEPKLRLGRGQKVILRDSLTGVTEGETLHVIGKLSFELIGRTTFARPVVIAKKIKKLKK